LNRFRPAAAPTGTTPDHQQFPLPAGGNKNPRTSCPGQSAGSLPEEARKMAPPCQSANAGGNGRLQLKAAAYSRVSAGNSSPTGFYFTSFASLFTSGGS
jgi:hypothetical protein